MFRPGLPLFARLASRAVMSLDSSAATCWVTEAAAAGPASPLTGQDRHTTPADHEAHTNIPLQIYTPRHHDAYLYVPQLSP